MVSKKGLLESTKCNLFILLMVVVFTSSIFISGEITNNSLIGMFPKFSWEMINTFDEIFR